MTWISAFARPFSAPHSLPALSVLGVLATACTVDDVDDDAFGDDNGSSIRRCREDNGSIELPPGFCATVFADDVGAARQIAVSPDGIVFVAVSDGADDRGVVALVDDDDDGVADRKSTFGSTGGNGIAWHAGHLYLAQNDRIVRWALGQDELFPSSDAETVVSGLVADGDHSNKTIVFGDDGALYVNIGSASNACQVDNHAPGSPGIDPCPELEVRAGIWRFELGSDPQTAADGERYATGVRNAVAMAIEPSSGVLVAVANGRDELHDNWPELYTREDDARLPAEELVLVQRGADYGWPYCYYDDALEMKVLAPEYGGDGTIVGRCAAATGPDATFAAHLAPLSIHFYRGEMFPGRYGGGAFVAFHGNRFVAEPPAELAGYNVTFASFADGRPTGESEIFADDLAGPGRPLPDAAEHRPVGLAEALDGSLYVSDDQGGRIWRIYYELGRTP